MQATTPSEPAAELMRRLRHHKPGDTRWKAKSRRKGTLRDAPVAGMIGSRPRSISGRDPCTNYAEAGIGTASGAIGDSSGSTCGSHSSQRGKYQFHVAEQLHRRGQKHRADDRGVEQDRSCEPDAELLEEQHRERAKIANTPTMTIAALVTTPAVDLMPCATASSVLAPRSNASRIRLMMKTW